MVEALKARNKYWSAAKDSFMSRLQRFEIAGILPGALPQAVALRTFGADETADQVGKLTVFNVAGNKVRIVEAIHYNRNRIYIRAVLTHEDMTRESGRNDNAKSGRSQNYQRVVLPC